MTQLCCIACWLMFLRLRAGGRALWRPWYDGGRHVHCVFTMNKHVYCFSCVCCTKITPTWKNETSLIFCGLQLDTKKTIVSHIVSFPPLNCSPSVLAVLLVVVLVVMLFSCCYCCLCLLCCRVANTIAAATIGMPPPPPPPSVGMEVDACYANADSSPTKSS